MLRISRSVLILGLPLLPLLCAMTYGSEVKVTGSLARSPREIAEEVGAARYEEFGLESAESRHSREQETGLRKIKKRLAGLVVDSNQNQEVEFQVYQGVMGRAGVDFPVFPSIPHTGFSCKRTDSGYHADLDTNCQVFHICDGGRKISFLCPNGTIFKQQDLICDWWFKVDCGTGQAPPLYQRREENIQERRNQPYTSNNPTASNDSREYRAEASFANYEHSNPRSNSSERNIRKSNRSNNNSKNNNQNSGIKKQTNSRQYSSFEYSSGEYSDYDSSNEKRKGSKYSTRVTIPQYTDSTNYRMSTSRTPVKESQLPAETASFASRNRQSYGYYQNFNSFTTRTTTEAPNYPRGFKLPEAETKNRTQVTNTPARSNAATLNAVSKQISPFLVEPSTSAAPVSFKENKTSSVKKGKRLEFTTQTPYATERSSPIITSSTPYTTAPSSYVTPPKPNVLSASRYVTAGPSYVPPSARVTPPRPYITPPSARASSPTSYVTVPTAYKATPSSYITPPVSEHAMSMIRTLQELELDTATPTSNAEKYLGERRIGLNIPPSSGPDTLRSLALYFATAVDNYVTKAPEVDHKPSSTTEIEYVSEENRAVLRSAQLSQSTLDKYAELFRERKPDNSSEDGFDSKSVNASYYYNNDNDLESEQSRGPLASITTGPQIRELAQVFTHALSAYLQDPETFRRVLAEIRPTEPPSEKLNEIEKSSAVPVSTDAPIMSNDEEILDFSDVTKSTTRQETTYSDFTTESTFTTMADESTTDYPALLNSISADRLPGSNLITKGIRKVGQRQPKNLNPTTEASPTLSTIIVSDSWLDDNATDYFPMEYNKTTSTSSLPYGYGVKHENSTPIMKTYPTSLADMQAIPLNWGDILPEQTPNGEGNIVPSVDLIPPQANGLKKQNILVPSKQFLPPKTTPLPPSTVPLNYRIGKSYEQNENLQRAQSQSFVSNSNSLRKGNSRRVQSSNYVTVPSTQEKLTTMMPATASETTDRASTIIPDRYATAVQESLWTTSTTVGDLWKSTIFLDPLTINQELTELTDIEDKTVTPSPNTYLPKGSTDTTTPITDMSTTDSASTVTESNKQTTLVDSFTTSNERTTIVDDFEDSKSTTVSDTDDTVKATKEYNENRKGKSLLNKQTTNIPTTIEDSTITLTTDGGLPTTFYADNSQSKLTTLQSDYGTSSSDDYKLTTNYNQPTTNVFEPSISSRLSSSESTTQQPTTKYHVSTTNSKTTTIYKETSNTALPANPTIITRVTSSVSSSSSSVSDSARRGKALVTPPTPIDVFPRTNDYQETMQQRANEMFGSLNASTANALMNVMKQADSNTTVRRLILLLVQTCDEDINKTVEESRAALLDALISTPVDRSGSNGNHLDDDDLFHVVDTRITKKKGISTSETLNTDESINYPPRKGKSIDLTFDQNRISNKSPTEKTSTTSIQTTTMGTTMNTETTPPETTSQQTTTDAETTTIITTTSSSTSTPPITTYRSKSHKKFVMKPEEEKLPSESRQSNLQINEQKTSDGRALELLRSLYSLAAKWG